MPSVFTLTAADCPWQIKKGRKIVGCFASKSAAKKAARRRGGGWRASFSRPPGMPISGLNGPGTCKFVAKAHVKNPKPPKPSHWRKGKPLRAPVSASGWRRALGRARELRDSTVFLDCPGGSIALARCYDYECRTTSTATERKVLAGRRRR